MKSKKMFFLSCLLFIFANHLTAQDYIDSLKIIPQTPDTSDLVKVVCFVSFPVSNCTLDSVSVHPTGSEINISSYYNLGDLTMPCTSSDTINIGKLSYGEYHLKYEVINKGDSTSTIDSLNFNVDATNGIENTKQGKDPIKVYPNPTTEIIYLDFENHVVIKGIKLHDLNGKIIKTYSLADKKKLDVSGLPKGEYLLIIQTDNSIVTNKILLL